MSKADVTRRQAVLLIHGVGEQRPMDTLRGFVDTVWTTHTEIQNPHARAASGQVQWSKPDPVSDSFELRHITTIQNTARIRTDFFELYWQHLMRSTRWSHVLAWVASLLRRPWRDVPTGLKAIYLIGRLVAVAGFAALVYSTYAATAGGGVPTPAWVTTLSSLVLVPALSWIVTNIVGDAARYLHVAPQNIQSRHRIRQAGLETLEKLHERGYDRIIVVGHSLGSIIAYDILSFAWAAMHKSHLASKDHPPPETSSLRVLEGHARRVPSTKPESVRNAQAAVFAELKRNGNPWRVSDFVTLGSPLTHAAILLANDVNHLRRKCEEREFPTSPPVLEKGLCSYEVFGRSHPSHVAPHHAAVFAAVRWTNVFFPSRWFLLGDSIGGPIEPPIGTWVQNVSARTRQRFGVFSHTLYWSAEKGLEPHIVALRKALDLTDEGDPEP